MILSERKLRYLIRNVLVEMNEKDLQEIEETMMEDDNVVFDFSAAIKKVSSDLKECGLSESRILDLLILNETSMKSGLKKLTAIIGCMVGLAMIQQAVSGTNIATKANRHYEQSMADFNKFQQNPNNENYQQVLDNSRMARNFARNTLGQATDDNYMYDAASGCRLDGHVLVSDDIVSTDLLSSDKNDLAVVAIAKQIIRAPGDLAYNIAVSPGAKAYMAGRSAAKRVGGKLVVDPSEGHSSTLDHRGQFYQKMGAKAARTGDPSHTYSPGYEESKVSFDKQGNYR